MPFQRGYIPSEEHKRKLREARKGRRPNYGKHHSEEAKEKIRQGNINKYRSEETKKKLSQSKIGEKNPQWMGDGVSNNQLHQWVRRHKLRSEFCERCGLVPPYDVANISGKYKRDINDYEYLCRRCHMTGDGRMKNLRNQC